jgi:ferritin-like metal-binding protein YciE
MKLQTLHDLFILELQDLYDAENQILEALPKMAEAASDEKLRKGFQEHVKQTEDQIARLKEIANQLEFDLQGKKCKGMEGLIKEGEELLKEKVDQAVLDAALIGAAQKVEHYEIAGYGTAITYAKLMNHTEAEKLLKETMNEEETTDEKLTKLAEGGINEEANKEE